jgi:hypothetical protein
VFIFDWGYRYEAMHQPDWGYCPWCDKKFDIKRYIIGFKVLNKEYSIDENGIGLSVGYVFFECPNCFEKSYFHNRYGDLMDELAAKYIKNENDDFLKVLGARESLVKALKEYLRGLKN